MKSFWAMMVVGLGLAGNAGASRYEIPLPEWKGVYSIGDLAPLGAPAIPFPGTFERIDAVYLDITGNVAPSLWREADPSIQHETYPRFSFQFTVPIAQGGQVSAASMAEVALTEDGPFHVVKQFTRVGSGSGDMSFLTYGNARLHFFMYDLIPVFDINTPPIIVPAIAGITDAKLIVEGQAVPEPASGLIVLPAVLLLGRRRRRG